MICYKEVHKYNGRYYSRYDMNYEFKIGKIAQAKGDYIYATDTIENVLAYAYVPFDMCILKMETVGEYNRNGYVITAKEMKIIREVNKDEYFKSRKEIPDDESDSELYKILREKRASLLSDLPY